MHLLANAFSEQRWTIHWALAEGATAVMYCTYSGRRTGDFFGLPATGRTFACKQIHIIRFAGGRLRSGGYMAAEKKRDRQDQPYQKCPRFQGTPAA